MAQGCLHAGPKFAEGAMQLGDLKQRVVPKTVRAGRFGANPAAANAGAVGANLTSRIRNGDVTIVVACAFGPRCIRQVFEQLLVVFRIFRTEER